MFPNGRADTLNSMTNNPGRMVATLVAGIAAALVLAGCIPSMVAAPPGAGPLRYRDEVFADVSVRRDLQYGSAAGLDNNPVALKLDLYQPAGDAAAQRPAVIWVHGGGYVSGDKGSGPSAYLANKFARLGYVTVSINYRLLAPSGCSAGSGVSTACYAAAVAAAHDAQAVVRWLRANASLYRIDPTRIGIGGESAGAITSMLVGVWAEEPGDSGNPGHASNVGAWVSISGGLPGGALVNAGDAPGYLFAGTADPTVPYQWSVDSANALLRAGVPVVLKPLPGAGHVPWVQYQSLFEIQSDYFFYQYLDLARAAP